MDIWHLKISEKKSEQDQQDESPSKCISDDCFGSWEFRKLTVNVREMERGCSEVQALLRGDKLITFGGISEADYVSFEKVGPAFFVHFRNCFTHILVALF